MCQPGMLNPVLLERCSSAVYFTVLQASAVLLCEHARMDVCVLTVNLLPVSFPGNETHTDAQRRKHKELIRVKYMHPHLSVSSSTNATNCDKRL